MVLCYIPLCNSWIKEKLTLTDELIPQAQMATDRQQDRQMDRWTHRQRSKRGGDHIARSKFGCECVSAILSECFSKLPFHASMGSCCILLIFTLCCFPVPLYALCTFVHIYPHILSCLSSCTTLHTHFCYLEYLKRCQLSAIPWCVEVQKTTLQMDRMI